MNTQTTVSMELGFFLASFAAGIFAALLYDILRISRRIIGPKDAIVTFEDILFLTATAFLLFYAAYKKNDGELRWHSFIGGGLGVIMYIIIVRNRFLNLSIFLIKWAVKFLEKALYILCFPVRLFLRIFKKPVNIIIWYTGRKIRRARRLVRCKGNSFRIKCKKTLFLLRKK